MPSSSAAAAAAVAAAAAAAVAAAARGGQQTETATHHPAQSAEKRDDGVDPGKPRVGVRRLAPDRHRQEAGLCYNTRKVAM